MSTPGIDTHGAGETVVLGTERYVVVPQKHTRVKRGIDLVLGSMGSDGDLGNVGGLVDLLGAKAYDLVQVFIPNVMPRSDWESEDDDGPAPTIPEIGNALKVGARVNGLVTIQEALGKFVSPAMVQSFVALQMANAGRSESTSSSGSPSSSGGSPSTPTTTSPAT